MSEQREFQTGALRNGCAGKGRFDLIPAKAVLAVAKVYQDGAERFGERNWERGIPLSSFLDSALRHIYMHLDGDRKEDHLARAVWNLMGCIETGERIREGRLPAELDTLPKPPVDVKALAEDILKLNKPDKSGGKLSGFGGEALAEDILALNRAARPWTVKCPMWKVNCTSPECLKNGCVGLSPNKP